MNKSSENMNDNFEEERNKALTIKILGMMRKLIIKRF